MDTVVTPGVIAAFVNETAPPEVVVMLKVFPETFETE
jgi:hypothetical protein